MATQRGEGDTCVLERDKRGEREVLPYSLALALTSMIYAATYPCMHTRWHVYLSSLYVYPQ